MIAWDLKMSFVIIGTYSGLFGIKRTFLSGISDSKRTFLEPHISVCSFQEGQWVDPHFYILKRRHTGQAMRSMGFLFPPRCELRDHNRSIRGEKYISKWFKDCLKN